MKYFILGDIHGDYQAMINALEKVKYQFDNKNHQIICLGDYFGRAENEIGDSKKVFEYLTQVKHINKPICLKGNHELILENIFKNGYLDYLDYCNGEHKTIASFAMDKFKDYDMYSSAAVCYAGNQLNDWIKSLSVCCEDDKFICTHGWLPHVDNLAQATVDEWKDAMWSNTVEEVEDYFKNYPNGYGKTIIVGHWTSKDFGGEYGKNYHIIDKDIWICDCTTAIKKGMECLVIEA